MHSCYALCVKGCITIPLHFSWVHILLFITFISDCLLSIVSVNYLADFLIVFQGTGEGVLFVFNPITGQPLAGPDGLIRLGYKVKQSFLLHEGNKESLRGILFLDNQDNLHVYPESSLSMAVEVAATTFIFTADPNSGLLVGYSLALSTKQVSIVG
jgi:hypothetical protein